MVQVERIIPGSRLFVGAVGFAVSARALSEEQQRNPVGLITPSFYVLTCYSFELSFKSVVEHSGGSQRDLRKIGHDLELGLQAALAAGYVLAPSLRVGELIAILKMQHLDSSMRYLIGDEPVVGPKPSDVLPALDAHLRSIDKQFALLPREHRGG